MLGGYLKEIPRCTLCEAGAPEGHDIATTESPYSHLEPWIEIWDRGRSEEEIDSMGARAHAAPKVVNGEIVKVIVTNSGTGYIDPVVMVRDAPPKHIAYHTTGGILTGLGNAPMSELCQPAKSSNADMFM